MENFNQKNNSLKCNKCGKEDVCLKNKNENSSSIQKIEKNISLSNQINTNYSSNSSISKSNEVIDLTKQLERLEIKDKKDNLNQKESNFFKKLLKTSTIKLLFYSNKIIFCKILD